MAQETISIVYKPLGDIAGVEYYHQTVVYTNSSGQVSIASGTYTGNPTGNNVFNASQASIAANTGGTDIYGNLGTNVGPESDFTDDQLINLFGTRDNPFPSQVVATGSDLSGQWNDLVTEENSIADQNLPYTINGYNSNYIAQKGLSAASIPVPNSDIASAY